MTHDHKKDERPDAEYIQGKIALIEKGLPIDITEQELELLEEDLRGARSFSIDLLAHFTQRKEKGSDEDAEELFTEESKNLAGVEMALRKVDEFRAEHWKQIKHID
ncbi:MAG: hypothetical protein M3Q63_02610 [bacterium]|nr:hypothetical protein [bacterium]